MMSKSCHTSGYDAIYLCCEIIRGAVSHYVVLINACAISVCRNIYFTARMEGHALNTVILSVMWKCSEYILLGLYKR